MPELKIFDCNGNAIGTVTISKEVKQRIERVWWSVTIQPSFRHRDTATELVDFSLIAHPPLPGE